jgi:hypothetical protein
LLVALCARHAPAANVFASWLKGCHLRYNLTSYKAFVERPPKLFVSWIFSSSKYEKFRVKSARTFELKQMAQR